MLFSIHDSLLKYLYTFPIPNSNKFVVFLHTSCVLDNSLEEVFSSKTLRENYSFYLMNDCYYELKLLNEHSKISTIASSAKLILENSKNIKVNIRDVYGFTENNTPILANKFSSDKNFIYVFYDGAAAEEFVYNTSFYASHKGVDINSCLNNHRILYFDNEFLNKEPLQHLYAMPVKLSSFTFDMSKQIKLFRERPIPVKFTTTNASPGGNNLKYDEYYFIDPQTNDEYVIEASKLNRIIGRGSAACVYELDTGLSKPYAVKIFNQGVLEEKQAKALEYLSKYNKIFRNKATFPIALVKDKNEDCIGYLMNYIEDGAALTHISYKDPPTMDVSKWIAIQLSLIILELRLLQLEIDDISSGNFLLTPDNTLVLADTDSLESKEYIFNRYIGSPEFAHKRIYELWKKETKVTYFRERHYNDFSYAVMLFYCYVGMTPLWMKNVYRQSTNRNWHDMADIIYEIGGVPNMHDDAMNTWNDRFDDKQKLAFCDTFCFKKDFSVGQWIEILRLIK